MLGGSLLRRIFISHHVVLRSMVFSANLSRTASVPIWGKPCRRRLCRAAQRDAEAAQRGIWSGSYVARWLYRACLRAGGRPDGCSDDAGMRR